MAGQHSHEPRPHNPTDLLHGCVCRARQSGVLLDPPSIDTFPHPARLRATQRHDRVGASRWVPH